MTSLLEPLIGDTCTAVSKDVNHNTRRRHYRHVLRSKENIYKNKCKKVLKRKLKKYKLRQDGKEDQEIIDVSETLISSLFIKSPGKVENSVELEIDELRPKNYLFRMVRRKQTTLKTTKVSQSSDKKISEENACSTISPAVEEKKQTNAFKLLMESRNRSLGTNSPGKAKQNDEAGLQEISEKKSIKVKRNLMLQKMAEEKGSLKKKEIEEQHEKYIKKKMENRAEKLKSMIMHNEPKTVTNKELNNSSQKTRCALDSINVEKNEKVVEKSPNTLQLINIFDTTDDRQISSSKKVPSKEDVEFLQKLSPSIKKKESMLSYFKKIEKEPEKSSVDDENNVVIKVKLGSKSKKRGRKKKLSLIRNNAGECDVPEIKEIERHIDEGVNIEKKDMEVKINLSENSADRKKRKREAKGSLCNITDDSSDVRPRRTLRRPVKYSDDVILSSSDEELHIFTPKKRKHSGSKNDSLSKRTDDIIIVEVDTKTPKSDKKLKKSDSNLKRVAKPTKNINSTKPVKLAPIFSKAQPDAAAIEAKQKFLQSGVPEQLKKVMSRQNSCNTMSNTFPMVVHVQQLDLSQQLSSVVQLSEEIHEDLNINYSNNAFCKMLHLKRSQIASKIQSKNNVNTRTILQNLKESYPRFPVYRIYKLLKSKKRGEYKDTNIFSKLDNSIEILNCSIDMQNDNPDQLTWSDKYKPLSGNEIIGNFESIKELKKWLETWTENESKSKVINSNDSDSSDFYQSEPDSRDSMKSYNNLLILSGPVGCGKTASVYAVAAELSIKVIEVNASSKRTGKIMLQDLQEATQSHKVNRGTGSNENSLKSQEIKPIQEVKVTKRGRPKKKETPKLVVKEKVELNCHSASQESTRTVMSLILIDDADIVFEQDDGFCSAIMQLAQCSKRPVILVTGSLTIPHLQKFLLSSKIIKMKPLLPNMLGMCLDLICLVDSGTCWPGLGAKFLNFFKGDMRRTINHLQFYVGSQEHVLSLETNSQNNDVKMNVDDESSCTSWTDHDMMDDKNANCNESQPIWDTFLNEHQHLKNMKCPLKMFDIWWSVPKMLGINTQSNSENSLSSSAALFSLTNVLDSISECDYFTHKKPEREPTMISYPWYSAESDSVSELENLDSYDFKHDTTKKLCSDLVKGSFAVAQENMGWGHKYDFDCPEMSVKRQRERTVSRHTELTSYLTLQSSLNRRALALDYWPSCRAICSIERSKTDSNCKRNNRFCHYLKSLNVQCTSDAFDKLASSLNPSRSS